jgi:hypothetical protein
MVGVATSLDCGVDYVADLLDSSGHPHQNFRRDSADLNGA